MVHMQSWNNVVDYIKKNLGVPINMLELSGDEIIKYLKEHTLVEFSQYVPNKRYYVLSNDDLVDSARQKYKINVNDYIIDVVKIYTFESTYPQSAPAPRPGTILNTVMFAKFEQMVQSLSPVITWEFTPPNYITFFYIGTVEGLMPMLVEYSTTYENLNEMPPDLYPWFKKLCLADIKILIGSTRTKYQLATPFGQIMTNGEMLRQEGMQERQIVIDNLMNNIPPDILIDWVY